LFQSLIGLINFLHKQFTLTPEGKVASIANTFNDCTATKESVECRQRWQFSLTLTERTCTLDGAYRVNYTTICSTGASASECPLTAADGPAGVDFTLRSENFCAEVTVDVGLVGSMETYQENTFTTKRTAFVVGQTCYFLVKVDSELNAGKATPVITFSKTVLKTVTVRQQGTGTIPIRLYEDYKVAVFDATTTPSVDPKTNIAVISRTLGNEIAFSFVFSTEISAALQQNGQLKFTVGAEVQVTYANGKKRQEAAADASSYSADIEFTNDGGATGTESGSSSSAYHVVVGLFALLFCMFM